jgi:hypothetical protein
MKTHSQGKKIIAILLTFGLLIEFTGCYSVREISSSEIKPGDKNLIHAKNFAYTADSIAIFEGILTGKLDLSIKDYGNEIRNHIYVSSDTAVKINQDIIIVPLTDIRRIECSALDPDRTKKIATTAIIIGGVVVITGAILIGVMVKGTVEIIDDIASVCTDF